MADKFTVIKAYQENENYRQSFNKLLKKTFGLDFEDWFRNGYWKNGWMNGRCRTGYVPYSILIQGEVAANVSVSPMKIVRKGEHKVLLQLGTVMTEESFRNRGLIRRLMQEIYHITDPGRRHYTVCEGAFLSGVGGGKKEISGVVSHLMECPKRLRQINFNKD